MAPRTSTRDVYVIEGVNAEDICPIHGARRARCGCGLPRLASSTADEKILDEQRAQEERVLAEGHADAPRNVAVFTRNDSFWDAMAIAQREASKGRRAWIEFQTNEDGTITAALVMSQAAA